MGNVDDPDLAAEIVLEGAEPLPHVAELRRFEEFFRQAYEPTFKTLWVITRDRHEAEEVLQEAFVRMWARWNELDVDDPQAYLYRIALNLFRSRRRKAALRVRRVLHALPPDDGFAAIEEKDSLLQALGALSARERAAIVLVDLLDMDSETAGDALGIRASTVRVLASRARSRLRERMADRDG